jgi:NADH-quinone oxidoreductase subunit G
MVNIEIDGKHIEAQDGATIIQVADEHDIHIPRFCYHNKLPIAANCRMCLVEVEKAPKALPACATNVGEGMKVFTKSPRAIQAQKSVMEFLLINHPLDCPICDQGGQCELQDNTMGFGADVSAYNEPKRAVTDPDIGPFIATELTRCIQCTRCVRFGELIAGDRELGLMNRGEDAKISTYIKKVVKSELSGNVIDICPVGALTSKPSRFTGRAWEEKQIPGVAAHDCLGSNLHLDTLREKLLRVAPRENEKINEVWISDRDRFSYLGMESDQRALKPMVKKQGKWIETDWETALSVASDYLKKIASEDSSAIGALVSPNSTTEEFYLLQKIMRSLGSNNVDHRLRTTDCGDDHLAPIMPNLGMAIKDIEKQEVIFLVGSDIRYEQPIASMKIRKATLAGGDVYALNMVDFNFNFPVKERITVKPSLMVHELAEITKAVLDASGKSHKQAEQTLKSIVPSGEAKTIAAALIEKEKAAIILGQMATNHPEASLLRELALILAELSGASVGCMTEGANAQGAWLAGAVSHRNVAGKALDKPGLSAEEMITKPLQAYVLLNVEPELDCAHSANALNALDKAASVIAMTPFVTEAVKQYATVILPIATFGETSGTFTNIDGTSQSFQGVVKPKGEARPAWKVLRVLANLLKLEGFNYMSSEDVLAEVRRHVDQAGALGATRNLDTFVKMFETSEANNKNAAHTVERITEMLMYASDPLCRQSAPIKAMLNESNYAAIRMNAVTAKKIDVGEGDHVSVQQKNTAKIQLLIMIDEAIPDGAAYVPAGIKETVGLGAQFGPIEIGK